MFSSLVIRYRSIWRATIVLLSSSFSSSSFAIHNTQRIFGRIIPNSMIKMMSSNSRNEIDTKNSIPSNPSGVGATNDQDDVDDFRKRYDTTYNPIVTIRNSTNLSSSSSSSSSSNDDHNNSSIITVRLPTLQYGYRNVPLSWKECYDIIMIQHDIPRLSRSVLQQTSYELYKCNMLQSWKSIVDHILCTKFTNVFQKRYDETMQKYYAYPSLHDMNIIEPIVAISSNEFPYYMESNIDHHIIWKLGHNNSDITKDDIDHAKQQLTITHQYLEYIHWMNPPHLKSIPEIDHLHILCRKPEEKVLT